MRPSQLLNELSPEADPQHREMCWWSYTPKLHLLRFVIQQAVWRILNKSKVYTANPQQVVRHESASNQRPSTNTHHVKMLYSLSYDLLSNMSTSNRSSGVWAYWGRRLYWGSL